MAPIARWSTDGDGNAVMPDLWARYLDWLLSDPRSPSTHQELADSLDCHRDTLKRIRRDPRFVAEWERRADLLNISTDRIQTVVNALHRKAAEGDVKAAALYLQYVGRFMPEKKITVVQDVATMSDADLAAELELEARRIRGELPAVIDVREVEAVADAEQI